MDRMIYLAMNGAKALMQRQDALSNNLANANTDGFRADLMAFRSVPVRAEDTATTRVFALEATAGFNDQAGPDGELVCLEINTQPGMTPLSLAPEQARFAGHSFEDLVAWMVEDASCNR